MLHCGSLGLRAGSGHPGGLLSHFLFASLKTCAGAERFRALFARACRVWSAECGDCGHDAWCWSGDADGECRSVRVMQDDDDDDDA
eukprot:3127545-Rhodomonas_salina.1